MLTIPARQSGSRPYAFGYDGERLVNYSLRPSNAMSEAVLIGRSGLKEVVEFGAPVLALDSVGDTIYAVANERLWKVRRNIRYDLGALNNASSASLARSDNEVAVVMGGAYFVWNKNNGSMQSVDTGDVEIPRSVAYQDGYFIVAGEGQGRKDIITVSALDDGTTFTGLNFNTASYSSDKIVSVISDHGELWLHGTDTTEIFYNGGGSGFPFVRVNGAAIETGCQNGATVAKADNSVFWVGHNNVAYRSSGSTPAVISTREIEERIKTDGAKGGFVYLDRGHYFYCIVTNGQTLAFDLTTNLWSERTTGLKDGAWVATCSALADGKQYLGTSTGYLCLVDEETYSDMGDYIAAEMVSAPVVRGVNPFSIARIATFFRTGTEPEGASVCFKPPKTEGTGASKSGKQQKQEAITTVRLSGGRLGNTQDSSSRSALLILCQEMCWE